MKDHVPSLICIIVASLTAGLLWHIPTKWIVSRLWQCYYKLPKGEEQIGGKELHEKVQIFVMLLGVLERMLYAGSWLFGTPEIIAVVLLIKAAPQLKEWEEDKVMGRAQYNVWLIGNLISIIGSVLIAELTRCVFYMF